MLSVSTADRILLPGTLAPGITVQLHGQRDTVVVLEVANGLTLKQEDYPRLTGWAPGNHMSPSKSHESFKVGKNGRRLRSEGFEEQKRLGHCFSLEHGRAL